MTETNTRPTKEILKDAIAALPEETDLIYIDRGDNLSPQECAKLVAGEKDDIIENRDFTDNQDASIMLLLEEAIKDEDEREALKDSDDFNSFQEECYARDCSTPFDDLLGNTGSHLVRFYIRTPEGERIAMEEDSWRWDDKQVEEEASRLAGVTGLDFTTNRDALRELVQNATYGGVLCVIACVNVILVDEWVEHCLRGDQQGWVKLTFTNPYLLLHDSWNGSGHDVKVNGGITISFGYGALHATHGVMALDCQGVGPGYSWDETASPYKPAYKTTIKDELYQAEKNQKPDKPALESWPGR